MRESAEEDAQTEREKHAFRKLSAHLTSNANHGLRSNLWSADSRRAWKVYGGNNLEKKLRNKRIRLIAIALIILAGIGFRISRLNVEPADYRVSLEKRITKAEKLLEKADIGNEEGKYAAYTARIFKGQIDTARQTAEDEESYYEQLKASYETLGQCMDIFKDSKNQDILEEAEVASLAQAGNTKEYEIELSVYRSIEWHISGEAVKKAAPWNLCVREDGPFQCRMLAYMEEFSMEGSMLAFYHDGDFPGEASVSASYYPKTETAYIYELDPETNTLSYMADGAVEGEKVTFSLKHGGSYLVLAQKLETYADKEQLSGFAKRVTEKEQEYDLLSAQNVKENQDKVAYIKNHGKNEQGEDVALNDNAGHTGTGAGSGRDAQQPDGNPSEDKNRTPGEGSGNTGSGSTGSGSTGSSGTGSGSSGSGGNGTGSGSGSAGSGGSGTGTGSGGSGTGAGSGNTGSGSGGNGSAGSGNTGGGSTGSGGSTKDELITVYISIDCFTLAGDGLSNLIDENLAKYVPSDGVILKRTAYQCKAGTSVYEVLSNVCRNKNIQMEATYTPLYSGYYIKGINYLYEFHGGTYSGWLYRVNDIFPNYGCSRYFLEEGDEIVWSYTCTEGDVPGTWME